MNQVPKIGPWVVYQSSPHGRMQTMSTVCTKSEWDTLQASHPGIYTLVRSGLATEAAAECAAREAAASLRTTPRWYRW